MILLSKMTKYHFIDYVFGKDNIGNVNKISMKRVPQKVEIRLAEEEPHLKRIKSRDHLFLYDLDNGEIFAEREVFYSRRCKLCEVTSVELEMDNNRKIDNIIKVMSKVYGKPVTKDSKVFVIRHLSRKVSFPILKGNRLTKSPFLF